MEEPNNVRLTCTIKHRCVSDRPCCRSLGPTKITMVVPISDGGLLQEEQIERSGKVKGLIVSADGYDPLREFNAFEPLCHVCGEYDTAIAEIDKDMHITTEECGFKIIQESRPLSEWECPFFDSDEDDSSDGSDSEVPCKCPSTDYTWLYDSIKVTIDTHWNCYCKHRKVCGCGCDKLHDGW